MLDAPQPQVIRRDNAFSIPKDPGEIFNCIVTKVTPDGRIHIHVPELGSDLGPVLPLDTDLTKKYKVDDTVVGTFLTSAMTSFVILGSSKSSNRSSILVFPTELERTAALGMTPSTGVFTYVTATSAVQYWDGSAWMSIGGGSSSFEYKVGDTGPGGGIIFFVDRYDEYPGFTYLEVGPSSSESAIPWAQTSPANYSNTAVDGAKLKTIGGGYQNSLDIINQGNNNPATCAAKYCRTFTGPGPETDWYLPSIGELILLHNAIHVNLGLGGFTESGEYWSSTETSFDPGSAFFVGFGMGNRSYTSKNAGYGGGQIARPIRRF